MTDQKKKDLKQKIIKFVTQTQNPSPNPITFNEFSLSNPDRKQKMEKQEALAIALKLIKGKKIILIKDNDSIEEFNQLRYLELAEKDNHKDFIEEYSRFLSRCDVMGTAFNKEKTNDFLGGINYDMIDKISEYITDMNFEVRQDFANNFNTYLVKKFFLKKNLGF